MLTESEPAAHPAQVALDCAFSFVDQLARLGMTDACICPGSRSTPLALAFANHPRIQAWTHVDERSAAFFAMGLAKGSRRPAAVICTSGTAAANFFPAVVESKHSAIPLILLTADRPPELHDTGALQSIDQLRIYGSFVNWFTSTAVPEESKTGEAYFRSISTEAIRRATSAGGFGPVHVNMPFREPMIGPGPLSVPSETTPEPIPAAQEAPAPTLDREAVTSLVEFIRRQPRGLIVCGPQDDPAFVPAVAQLAAATRYPVLADPLSQLRCHFDQPDLVIANYDLLLRNAGLSRALEPQIVLRFGMTPTSKPLLQYLESHPNAVQISIFPGGRNDPGRVCQQTLDVSPGHFAQAIAEGLGEWPPRDAPWIDAWLAARDVAAGVVEDRLAQSEGLTEVSVFRHLSEVLPSEALLFCGNSMPVRDLDAFFPPRLEGLRMLGNRGVNGIDGVVSTALGAAAATDRRVVLVLGDLSFYHDMNGLLAAKLHQIDATIILLNNDGGGIFQFLPQAQHPEVLVRYFSMPTGLDFDHAVRLYGGRSTQPETVGEFREAVQESFSRPGLTVVEVRSDRDQNVHVHQEIWEDVSRALDDSWEYSPV